MPLRLEFCLKHRDDANKMAEQDPLGRENWMRLSEEWQKLHDAVARQMGQLPDGGGQPDTHVLDS